MSAAPKKPKAATAASCASYRPAHLGKRSTLPVTQVDRIPWSGGPVVVELVCDEFTSLCPVTAQPDFGTVTVRYAPGRWLVETKSLKLYFWHFRDRGVFNEALIAEIADDLLGQLAPEWIEVTGDFNSRGGIAIHVTARREEECPF